MATTTLTRRGEPTLQYVVSASDGHDVSMGIADQLSSPIASYQFYNGLCIQHRDSYSVRLKVCTVFLFISMPSEVNS